MHAFPLLVSELKTGAFCFQIFSQIRYNKSGIFTFDLCYNIIEIVAQCCYATNDKDKQLFKKIMLTDFNNGI